MPKIALVQMVSRQYVDENLLVAENLIIAAAAEHVDAIFLPENFLALAHPQPLQIGVAENTADGPGRRFLANISAECNCWIFAGTLPVASRIDGSVVPSGRVRAASFVFGPDGKEVARYDKVHMFDVVVEDNHKHYVESLNYEPGEQVVVVETPFGKVGLSVCYDIRFPEIYRQLSDAGARSFSIPSAFTETTGEAHFEILMRARAIDNFAFTIAACQGGLHDSGRETYGNSMVVSPWGEVIARAGKGEQIVTAELDYTIQDEIRRDMPIHLQRRL